MRSPWLRPSLRSPQPRKLRIQHRNGLRPSFQARVWFVRYLRGFGLHQETQAPVARVGWAAARTELAALLEGFMEEDIGVVTLFGAFSETYKRDGGWVEPLVENLAAPSSQRANPPRVAREMASRTSRPYR